MKPTAGSVAKASALFIVIVSLFVGGAVSPAHAADEYDGLRSKLFDTLTGGTTLNLLDPDIAARVDEIETVGQNWWTSMNVTPTRPRLWNDLAQWPNNSNAITSTYVRLKAMALAYSTDGSSLEGNASLLAEIVSGLDWMDANVYSSTSTVWGNWWDWEVGAPRALNDIVVLLYPHLSPTQISNYMAAVDEFVPSVSMTGANRVWLAQVVAIRAIIVKDPIKLAAARDGLSPVFDNVTSGDGFYADGSFLQHDKHPYTGGYGTALLLELSSLMYLLAGSTWEVVDADQQNVIGWVRTAFQPMIYNGAMMDMQRGRELSRNYNRDHAAGQLAILGILRLAETTDSTSAAELKSMVKYWIQVDTYRDFLEFAPVNGILLAQAVIADPAVVPRGELVGSYQFAEMDRAVHLRPGWGIGLSMSSKRVYNYESIGNENVRGWYTGDGMLSLYNADQSYYSDDYWYTVNPYRLPGTTVDTMTRANASGQRYASASDWVGGVGLDGAYGASGMELDAWNSTLTARKSWFMFDDEVVALGSGITSTDGRPIETIVDNRRLGNPGTNAITVNGTALSSSLGWSGTLSGVNRLHIAGSIPGTDVGYYFPTSPTVKGVREARTGSWSVIDKRTGIPTTTVTSNYGTFWFDHGSNPTNADYAYVMLPGSASADVDSYATSPDVTVLENSTAAHAVRESTLGIVAANFWTSTPHTVDLITSNAKASVMTKETATELEVAASRPTQLNSGVVEIELARAATSVVFADPSITVTQLSPTIKFTFNPGTSGATVTAKFALDVWNLVDDDMASFASGWSQAGTGGTVTQGSGFTTVSSTSLTTYKVITKNSFTPPSGPFTFETTAKTTSGTSAITVRSGSYQVSLALVHGTSGFAQDLSASPTRSVALDTTVYHSYRVVVHADHSYDLYVDGVLAWAGAASNGTGTNLFKIGSGSPYTGKVDIDHVRMGSGELVP